MSWSYQGVGKPEKVCADIDAAVEKCYGQSKVEFAEAAPHLKALVAGNVGEKLVVSLSAGGHGTFVDGKKVHGNCSVTLQVLYGWVE
jgi:hypothetical protein